MVPGEENGHDLDEHEDWHDIKAGGKMAPGPKTTSQRKNSISKDEIKSSNEFVEQQVK